MTAASFRPFSNLGNLDLLTKLSNLTAYDKLDEYYDILTVKQILPSKDKCF